MEQGAARFAFACSDSTEVDDRLPQGHVGLGFDGRDAEMVETFGMRQSRFSGNLTAEPVWLVPQSALLNWSEQPVLEGHVLELLDANGDVVHTHEPVRGGLEDGSAMVRWSAVVVQRPVYVSYRIRHADEIVVEAVGSELPPILDGLTASLPDPDRYFSSIQPDVVRFSWRACEPDADALHQRTYYSSDGGAGYLLVDETAISPQPRDLSVTTTTIYEDRDPEVDFIMPDAADTSEPRDYIHVENPWNLPRESVTADSAHFLVVVSDGVRWSAARSNDFKPAPHPEIDHVEIWLPEEADAYGPDDEIPLLARGKGALTVKNRFMLGARADRAPYLSTTPTASWAHLPVEMYRWSSDIDGEILLDPPAFSDSQYTHGRISAGSLTPGTHRITATATDETGNTGSATVTIEVLAE